MSKCLFVFMISYSFCFVFWHRICFQSANHRWLVWSFFLFTNYLLSVTTMKWSHNHVCLWDTVYLLVPTVRPSCRKFANMTDLVMKSTCWSQSPQSKVSLVGDLPTVEGLATWWMNLSCLYTERFQQLDSDCVFVCYGWCKCWFLFCWKNDRVIM